MLCMHLYCAKSYRYLVSNSVDDVTNRDKAVRGKIHKKNIFVEIVRLLVFHCWLLLYAPFSWLALNLCNLGLHIHF